MKSIRTNPTAGAPEGDEIRVVSVKVVIEIDGEQQLLGQRSFAFGGNEHPADLAARVLDAWDAARETSEKTLRLYGAEGVIDNVLRNQSAATHGGKP